MGEFGGWGMRWAPAGASVSCCARARRSRSTRSNGTALVVTVDDAATGAALLEALRATRGIAPVDRRRRVAVDGAPRLADAGWLRPWPTPPPTHGSASTPTSPTTLIGHDPDLDAAVAEQNAAGLPPIEVAPVNGKLLHLLARISGARRVLEIGTLGAYSTIWLARGIPEDGIVVTIEAEPRNAEIARANLERAGVGDKVEIRIGRAADVLPTLDDEPPFDLVFIDADKESNTIYLDWAARLGRPGTVVVVDNVGRGGRVADPATDRPAGDRHAARPRAPRARPALRRHRAADARREGLGRRGHRAGRLTRTG